MKPLRLLLSLAAVNALFPRHANDRAGVDAMYERGRR